MLAEGHVGTNIPVSPLKVPAKKEYINLAIGKKILGLSTESIRVTPPPPELQRICFTAVFFSWLKMPGTSGEIMGLRKRRVEVFLQKGRGEALKA
jgi:hypothetical protein